MKLAVFDFDSTLMDGETIEFLAREAGVEDKVREITTRAMHGEIDFFESLIERVSLLNGLSLDKVNNICRNLPSDVIFCFWCLFLSMLLALLL